MSKFGNWQSVRAFHRTLATLHPVLSLEKPVPLRIGIGDDLRARYPEAPPKLVGRMLGWITKRRAYLVACTSGAVRYDLDGNAAGIVKPPQAGFARARFKERNAKASDPWPTEASPE